MIALANPRFYQGKGDLDTAASAHGNKLSLSQITDSNITIFLFSISFLTFL